MSRAWPRFKDGCKIREKLGKAKEKSGKSDGFSA
jgi:hypothetical protein